MLELVQISYERVVKRVNKSERKLVEINPDHSVFNQTKINGQLFTYWGTKE